MADERDYRQAVIAALQTPTNGLDALSMALNKVHLTGMDSDNLSKLRHGIYLIDTALMSVNSPHDNPEPPPGYRQD